LYQQVKSEDKLKNMHEMSKNEENKDVLQEYNAVFRQLRG